MKKYHNPTTGKEADTKKEAKAVEVIVKPKKKKKD